MSGKRKMNVHEALDYLENIEAPYDSESEDE